MRLLSSFRIIVFFFFPTFGSVICLSVSEGTHDTERSAVNEPSELLPTCMSLQPFFFLDAKSADGVVS